MQIKLRNTEATEAFGAELSRLLPHKCLIFLKGQLGAGKTTLVRGLLRAFGHQGAVKSPTYTLVEEYMSNGRAVIHFDLYRLSDPEELEWIGINDYLDQDAVCLIEWPEMGEGFLPEPDLVLTLSVVGQERNLKVEASNLSLKNFLSNVIKQRHTAIL
ncbi:tRNA (adenosine(37)-N6)-threonylcarbamoyltransferase complex ATPase subunit type 1 TsaE [Methylotuvimicrobium alcaliphilum]|uniref:tRNA threonylcarbamoyladenosine biosynthesis protein TsaE n=1 Tax=Methylotuvimicrobium alcaliphilum (strain DSM 19304 / NCIMB 14124 / VKM B-2133 / 20Z) TaxID=1091494 RepID=G4SZB6_META2|nr:tRNA (adenosine(37)-N6)-threonylcarbamoyltransferase complex ATPase subunit type 1 TsaE [Methylotuvimicrobium alcaliphilum]CCE23253.1 Conserved hypothetical protein, putative ATPase [Methylotuvimicrobium alcaliphilum 20Z]